jgi:dephospho-CoA kinase
VVATHSHTLPSYWLEARVHDDHCRFCVIPLRPLCLCGEIMVSVALTGNIAAGKTTVAELFERWGATIIDADQLVRDIQRPGQPAFKQIAERFGNAVIKNDGSLDRGALRARVLADPAALTDLNRIVHPEVHRRRMQLLDNARARGDKIVVSDIPLLFEADDPTAFDAVVLVDAPDTVRRARLVDARGLPPIEADRMMQTQMPAATKRSRSDFVIENDGDIPALERAAALVWQSLLERA